MGSIDPASMQFLMGPPGAGGKGGLVAVLGATAGILGGVAGAIGLGLLVGGLLTPPQ